MRRICKQILIVLMTVVLVCAGAGQAYASSTKGIDIAKNGVVSIQFYLKDAAYYAIINGKAVKQEPINNGNDVGISSGSGFFVGPSGRNPSYIVTNHHVVADYIDAGEGGVYLLETGGYYTDSASGEQYEKVIGASSCELRVYYDDNDYDVAYVECYGDQNKVDLAVLTIRQATDKRKPLQIQVPADSMVGETVYTVGFPGVAKNMLTSASSYGIADITVSEGIISKFAADDKGVERIQTSAVIQHGNSGGPLITEDGHVVGVNTNTISNTSNEINYYSINSSELVKFLDKNNIPYQTANQGGFPIIIAAVIAVVVVLAAAAFVVLSKKKGAAPAQKGAASAQKGASGRSKAVQRAFLRSMAPQHNGLAVVLSAAPVLIGRDPANCKVVYKEGTVGVSGKHCSVSYDAASGEFIVTDLQSTYGTFLMSGQKLQANVPCRIKPGGTFCVGDRANAIRLEVE